MNYIHLSISVFIFLSCTTNKKWEEMELITFDVKESEIKRNTSLSELITIDSLIFLEQTENSLIGEISKVVVSDDRIYILDQYNSHAIFCFTKNGKFINSYRKLGRGPEEYVEINDIDYYNNKIYISVSPFRILILDKNLNFQEAIIIEEFKNRSLNSSIIAMNNDTIIISDSELPYKYNFYSINEKRFISHQSPALGQGYGYRRPPIVKSISNQLFVTERYNDTIFIIEKNKVIPKYFINYEKPASIKEKNELINRSVYDISPTKYHNRMSRNHLFFESNNYFYFSFFYNRNVHFYFRNKLNSNVLIFTDNLSNEIMDISLKITRGFYKDNIITYAEAYEIIENKEKIKFPIPSDFSEDSNPALVFYKPKFD